MNKTKQPRKQRKRLFNAPLHKRQKLVAATLEKSLRKKFKRRNLPVKKGDKVEIMRGKFKGMRGVIREVDLKKMKVKIEEIKRKKVDGTEIHVPFYPSNLKIIEPDLSDKKRQKIIKRTKGEIVVKKVEKKLEEKKEKKEAGFKCPICSEVFKTKQELNVHRGQKHKDFMNV